MLEVCLQAGEIISLDYPARAAAARLTPDAFSSAKKKGSSSI
jgi:hypothetical protein